MCVHNFPKLLKVFVHETAKHEMMQDFSRKNRRILPTFAGHWTSKESADLTNHMTIGV